MREKRSISIRFANGLIPVEVDALDLKNLRATAKLCRDGVANFRAAELVSKFYGDRTKWVPMAVYVVAANEFPVCKIGIASNPASRLGEIQVGNWNELSLAALVWSETGSYQIEQLALKAAKEMGIHLRGEWISATPQEATELVLKAARRHGKPVFDSGTWLDNWTLRLHALAEAKGRVGALERLAGTPRKFVA